MCLVTPKVVLARGAKKNKFPSREGHSEAPAVPAKPFANAAGEFLSVVLSKELREVKPMTLMTMGNYQPKGCYFPSVLC
jgi:hypothetical protein